MEKLTTPVFRLFWRILCSSERLNRTLNASFLPKSHRRPRRAARRGSDRKAWRQASRAGVRAQGRIVFYIDLCRCMNCAIDMDFIAVSSYGASAQSTGVVRLIKDLDNNITGRHVVIVEDIIDSGLTMQYLRQLFGARNPASITTISFLDKASRHPESYKTDMCGFEIPDEFVVGYGLDYANYYRNLPYIGILKPECYK